MSDQGLLINFSADPINDDRADGVLEMKPLSVQWMDYTSGARWAAKWKRNLRCVNEVLGKEVEAAIAANKGDLIKAIEAVNKKYRETAKGAGNGWTPDSAIPTEFIQGPMKF